MAGISQRRLPACRAASAGGGEGAPAGGGEGSAGDGAGRGGTVVWPQVPQKLARGLTSWPQLPQNRRVPSVDIGVVDISVILRPDLICGLALLGRAAERLLVAGCDLLMGFVIGPCGRFGALLVSFGGGFGALLVRLHCRFGALLVRLGGGL